MTERGVIRAVSGSTVTVKRNPAAACFGCLRGECREAGLITAGNPAGLDLAVGQQVETEFPPEKGQILLALCPPPLGFIAAYLVSGSLAPASGEPFRAACGVLGLFAAALAVYLFRRRFPSRALPRITKAL